MAGLARHLMADANDAADLAQNTMMAALERRPDPGSSMRGWLASVARNLASRARRGSARREQRERRAAREEAVPSAADVAERLETHQKVVAALARIEEPYRTTLMLRFFDGLAPREIARRSQVPVATVRTRIARGLERVRLELDTAWRGDRGAWMAALVPLAEVPIPIPNFPIGATLVNTKLVLAGVAGAALAVALALTMTSEAPKQRMHTAFTPQAAATAEAARAAGAKEGRGLAAAREAAGAPAPLAAAQPAASRESQPSAALRKIRGRVVDCAGRPAAAHPIRLARAVSKVGEAEPEPQLSVLSAEDGAFDLEIARGATGELESASESHATVLSGSVSADMRTGEPVVVVAPAIRLEGVVVDDRGNPMPDADVALSPPEGFRRRFREVLDFSLARSWSSRTDPAGRFSLPRIPQFDGARLAASREGWIPASIAEPAASNHQLVLRLARAVPAAGAIAGQVVDPTGAPVDRAYVSCQDSLVRTDRDGRFQILRGDGRDATLTAVAPGFLPAKQTIRKGADGWPGFLVMRLAGAALSIHGKVLAPDGAPIPRAQVWLANARYLGTVDDHILVLEEAVAGGTHGFLTSADGEGRFEFLGLLDQPYSLEAMDPRTLFVARSEPVPAGVDDVVLTMPKGEVRERVAGIVVNQDGKPMADLAVSPEITTFLLSLSESDDSHLSYDGGGEERSVRTDEKGRFSLGALAKNVGGLRIRGDAIVPKPVSLAGVERADDLRIVVSERCHLKVELLRKDEEIDGFQVQDADGKTLMINVFEGNQRSTAPWFALHDGVSGVVAVDQSARTLVLFRDRKEVRRVPIEPKPGKALVVRP